MEDSLYVFQIPNKDYIDVIDDVFRMVTIQLSIQFLYFLNSSDTVSLFSTDFVLLVIYMILGILFYRLVLRKMIAFK
jgi:hypothetical protein